MSVNEPTYVKETLAWCNKMRKQRGKKPLERLPRGHQSDPSSCPCGKATGLTVYDSGPYGAEGREGEYVIKNYRVPRAVGRFIIAFDKGKLPQYVVGYRKPKS